VLAASLVALHGCDRVADIIKEPYEPETPHEAYAWSLEQAGLTGTALGRDWLGAADRALREPFAVPTPFRETGFLPRDEATALAYRIEARRGDEVNVEFALDADPFARVFLDVYRLPRDPEQPLVRFSHADSGATNLVFEPRRDEAYIIRLQPELLRGGRYTVSITLGPSLAFPVEGARDHDIGSFFGDSRDGGIRDHHGIDIFAARNTPALAVADAVVTRVQETERGGKVVWLRDEQRGQNLYYAHLDSQAVTRGTQVRQGDTVGFVGNTGNARTTPPHLHFGVYARGPVNPMPYVVRTRPSLPSLRADTMGVGEWRRSGPAGLVLRASPDLDAGEFIELIGHTAMRVFGAYGDWYRVRLPDGRSGFVVARDLVSIDAPILTQRLADTRVMRASPDAAAPVVGFLGAGQEVDILGRFADFALVSGPAGRLAWLLFAAEPDA
jgi:murein DD-endopeptidase MepM/ murein hydrolase activator NlpD